MRGYLALQRHLFPLVQMCSAAIGQYPSPEVDANPSVEGSNGTAWKGGESNAASVAQMLFRYLRRTAPPIPLRGVVLLWWKEVDVRQV